VPKHEISWVRVLVEGIVIIVSILLAFGIDTWWAGVQERREESAALKSLVTDLEANVAELDEAISRHSDFVRRLHYLEGASAADLHALPQDSVRPFLNAIGAYHSFDSQSGTLDRLIASGDLGLVSDEGLRAKLIEWQAAVADVMEEGAESREQAVATDERLALLGGPWLTSVSVPFQLDGWGEEFAMDPSVELPDLMADTELRGRLRHKRKLSIVYLLELVPIREQSQDLLSELRAAIGGLD